METLTVKRDSGLLLKNSTAQSSPNTSKGRPHISVISPVYRAEKIVDALVERLRQALGALEVSYEILLVEDGSPDNSWERVYANCERFAEVKGLRLSRNFGQHYAISAGLAEAQGDYVVVIDCDLQEDPAHIARLYQEAQNGADIVYTRKIERKHAQWKNLSAQMFFGLFNFLVNNQTATAQVGSFSMLSRRVVEAFKRNRDVHRHYLMVLRTLGFKATYVDIPHQERYEGKSSYTLRKLISHAVDGIASQSNKLLNISIVMGLLYFVASFIAAIYLIIMYFVHGYKEGWASVMVLILLSTGTILVSLGILSLYIGKIFDQVRDRPLYIISEKINFDA